MLFTHRGLRLALAASTSLLIGGCGGGGASPGGGPTPAEAAPVSFFQTADTASMIRVIDLRTDLSKDSLWAIITTAVDRRYTIETRDKAAGTALTTWRPFVNPDGIPDLRYRRRVLIQFLGTDWRRLQVKSEATWQTQTGYDRDILIEAMADLRARAGRG